MTEAQLKRRIRDLEKRIGHERENVTAKLVADGITKKAADYLTTRAQTAPKQVMQEIEKHAANPALGGSVKRCVNLIKELNGKYWQFRTKAEKRGLQV